jgi:predicted permease
MIVLDTFTRLSGIIAPNALLVVVGWLLGRMGRIPSGEVMAPLLTDVATPCLVLSIFTHMQLAPQLLISVGLGAVASLAIFLVASDALLRVAGLCPRTYLGPLSFPNTGNLGIPSPLPHTAPSGSPRQLSSTRSHPPRTEYLARLSPPGTLTGAESGECRSSMHRSSAR